MDVLAEQLGRSVAIDDHAIRLLAASRHFGDEDAVRVRSVLRRSVSSEDRDYAFAHGIARWDGPGRLPASTDLGLQARVCVPIRCHGLLLGFLWLIDADGSLRDEQIAAATAVAESAGLVLYRRQLLHERERSQEEALLRDLVSADPAVRARAQAEATADRTDDSTVAVASLRVLAPGGIDARQVEVALREAVEGGVRASPTGSTMSLAQGRHGLLLHASPAEGGSQTRLADLAAGVVSAVCDQLDPGTRCVAGLGSTQDGFAGAATSHHQAEAAAEAARRLPGLGDLVTWSSLGIYGPLLRLSPEDLGPNVFPDPLRHLADDSSRDMLIHTIETYLDCAGNAQRTAEMLDIHRTTLYYRLGRVEKATGMKLGDGGDRLTLHLGVKLARLAGIDEG